MFQRDLGGGPTGPSKVSPQSKNEFSRLLLPNFFNLAKTDPKNTFFSPNFDFELELDIIFRIKIHFGHFGTKIG